MKAKHKKLNSQTFKALKEGDGLVFHYLPGSPAIRLTNTVLLSNNIIREISEVTTSNIKNSIPINDSDVFVVGETMFVTRVDYSFFVKINEEEHKILSKTFRQQLRSKRHDDYSWKCVTLIDKDLNSHIVDSRLYDYTHSCFDIRVIT